MTHRLRALVPEGIRRRVVDVVAGNKLAEKDAIIAGLSRDLAKAREDAAQAMAGLGAAAEELARLKAERQATQPSRDPAPG